MTLSAKAELDRIKRRELKRLATDQWHMKNPGYHKRRRADLARAEKMDGEKSRKVQTLLNKAW